MAGSYQPEAMQQLARIETPQFVAVVGKPSLYQTPDGSFLNSIRLESVTLVDKETRDIWVLDTAAQTLDRIDAYGTTPDSIKAKEEYKNEPQLYRKMVYEALAQIRI
jgi:RPA family protein